MTQIDIQLPRGRLISGHPMKLAQGVDFHTKTPKIDKLGQPAMECFFQYAVSKADPGLYGAEGVFAKMAAAANHAWPENPDKDPTGFAWKMTDGDSQRIDTKTSACANSEGLGTTMIRVELSNLFSSDMANDADFNIDFFLLNI